MKDKRVVVIGGGTGSRAVLTGLKRYNLDITAIVAMSDDGGSSGRLRSELGHLPPGDLRQCLIALADDEEAGSLLARLFDYRFTAGNGLSGHSVGNLLLAALVEITGDVDAAIQHASQLLKVKGQVVPVTRTLSTLKAALADGTVVEGESRIDIRADGSAAPIDGVSLDPPALPNPRAIAAIERADLIVLAPGDIYTSILPNLLVEGIAPAICASGGEIVYVCNLMTKPGETDGFMASDFLRLLNRYLGECRTIDYLVSNSAEIAPARLASYARSGQRPVVVDEANCRNLANRIVRAPLATSGEQIRHSPVALGETLLSIIEGRLDVTTAVAAANSRKTDREACCLAL